MSKTKEVLVGTETAPIGHNIVSQITEIDGVTKSLGKKYLRTNEKGSRERGVFIKYLKTDTDERPRFRSTDLISPIRVLIRIGRIAPLLQSFMKAFWTLLERANSIPERLKFLSLRVRIW